MPPAVRDVEQTHPMSDLLSCTSIAVFTDAILDICKVYNTAEHSVYDKIASTVTVWSVECRGRFVVYTQQRLSDILWRYVARRCVVSVSAMVSALWRVPRDSTLVSPRRNCQYCGCRGSSVRAARSRLRPRRRQPLCWIGCNPPGQGTRNPQQLCSDLLFSGPTRPPVLLGCSVREGS